MRFKKCILILALLLLVVHGTCVVPVAYGEGSDVEIYDEIDRQLGELDLTEFEKFVDQYLGDILDESSDELFDSVMKGEVEGIGEIFTEIFQNLTKFIGSALSLSISIIIICVLYNTQNTFLPSTASLKGVVHFVLLSAILVLIGKNVFDVINVASDTMTIAIDFMDVVFPLLITFLSVVSGGVGAGIYSPILALFSNVIAKVVVGVVFPMFVAGTIISIVGNLSDSVKLGVMHNFIKTATSWIIGLSFGLFSLVSAGAGVLSQGVSSGVIKFTKSSITGYIPILGKYLETGIDIVSVGSVLIKNSIGIIALLVMIMIIIIPVIKCLVLSLSLNLCAGIVESFADSKVVNVLNGISSGIKTVIFALLGVGISFFVTVVGLILSVGVI